MHSRTLTDEQEAVALHGTGHALVSAVAGSGKTTTLVERIARLVQSGVAPERVLCLQFGKAAQQNFEARLRQRVPGAQPRVRTYHALALSFVQHFVRTGALPPAEIETRAGFWEGRARTVLQRVRSKDQRRIANLSTALPMNEFVPGMIWRGVCIGRPVWRPTANFRSQLRAMSESRSSEVIRAKLAEFGFPDWICLLQGGSSLPLSLRSTWMTSELSKAIRSESDVAVQDMYPKGATSHLMLDGSPFSHELQVSIRTHTSDRVRPRPRKRVQLPSKNAVVSPWAQWASLHLYGDRPKQNEFLSRLAILCKFSGDAEVRADFFFVRYTDSYGPHIRLRVRNGLRNCIFQNGLADLLENSVSDGVIDLYRIVSYNREYDRYGGILGCESCEELFVQDSAMVMEHFLSLSDSTSEIWKTLAATADRYLLGMGLASPKERETFAIRAAAEYSAEHRFSLQQNRSIGEVFRRSRSSLSDNLIGEMEQASGRLTWLPRYWDRVDKSVCPSVSRYSLRWAIIHMHFNRVLKRSHRIQEAVTWELLKRFYMFHSRRS